MGGGNAALRKEKKTAVAIFSLEMSKEQLTQRMLCSQARVNAHKVRTGFLAQSDWPKLTAAAAKLSIHAWLDRLAAAVPALREAGWIYLEAPAAWTDDALAPLGLRVARHLKAGAVHAHLLRRIA